VDARSWQAQRSSFGTAADLYDRVRPSYHEAAIQWALDIRPALDGTDGTVVDLGAGTGILSRQLLSLGYRCVPVEPDAAMRQRCDDRMRELFDAAAPKALDGSAEAIPLPDASAEAAVAGQAYHWFDPAKAHPEIARVLRPGGVFAPVWNIRDETEPWVAELTRVLRGRDGSGIHAGWQGVSLEDHFHTTEQATFRFAVRHTPDSLVDLLRSRSYYLTGSPRRRAVLERELRELLAGHPDLAGREEFELPYVTVAYRARRKPD
jgi:SAM-dependent methyltransferase